MYKDSESPMDHLDDAIEKDVKYNLAETRKNPRNQWLLLLAVRDIANVKGGNSKVPVWLSSSLFQWPTNMNPESCYILEERHSRWLGQIESIRI